MMVVATSGGHGFPSGWRRNQPVRSRPSTKGTVRSRKTVVVFSVVSLDHFPSFPGHHNFHRLLLKPSFRKLITHFGLQWKRLINKNHKSWSPKTSTSGFCWSFYVCLVWIWRLCDCELQELALQPGENGESAKDAVWFHVLCCRLTELGAVVGDSKRLFSVVLLLFWRDSCGLVRHSVWFGCFKAIPA